MIAVGDAWTFVTTTVGKYVNGPFAVAEPGRKQVYVVKSLPESNNENMVELLNADTGKTAWASHRWMLANHLPGHGYWMKGDE